MMLFIEERIASPRLLFAFDMSTKPSHVEFSYLIY